MRQENLSYSNGLQEDEIPDWEQVNPNTNNEQSAIQASTLEYNAVEYNYIHLNIMQHQVPSETTLSAEGMWGQPIFSDLLLFPPEGRSILIKSYNLLRLRNIVL